jgi:hypothetical protein
MAPAKEKPPVVSVRVSVFEPRLTTPAWRIDGPAMEAPVVVCEMSNVPTWPGPPGLNRRQPIAIEPAPQRRDRHVRPV